MAKNEIVITLKLNCELSLWQAIKLRIAGRNFKTCAEAILNEFKNRIHIT